ncbi:MAG TPA: S8 family serine peptidase [Anaerolineae bacterium]|nr:S8 family serine peptidase [Anaerolineae bacterium]
MKLNQRQKQLTLGALLLLLTLLFSLSTMPTGPVLADDDDDDDEEIVDFISDQVVVKVEPGVAIDEINTDFGTTTLEMLSGNRGIYLLQIPAGQSEEDLADNLEDDPRVRYAEPNFIGEAPEADRRTRGAWGGQDEQPYGGQYANSMLNLACTQTLSRGAGVTVAVLDTGIQLDHPALADRLVAGFDYLDDDATPDDTGDGEVRGHGTHVAGIIKLVAPEAKLMPVRVLDSYGYGNVFVIADAILWAAENGAGVINLSLGTARESELMSDIIAEVIGSYGTVIVAAAGNLSSSDPQYPAALDEDILAVGAVDQNKNRAEFSNYGDWLDVAAPGDKIYSTFPTSGYATWSGTSMSTPFVAGQAALLKSVAGSDPAGIIRLITATAESIDDDLGSGLINPVASLELATGIDSGCGQSDNGSNGNDNDNQDAQDDDDDDDDSDDDNDND